MRARSTRPPTSGGRPRFPALRVLAASAILTAPTAAQEFVLDGQVETESPVSRVVGLDLNGDGLEDVASIGISGTLQTGFVNTMLANGSGFDEPVTISVPGVHVYDLEAADVDGDGRDDLLYSGITMASGLGPGVVGVLSNDGSGALQAPTLWYLPELPWSLTVADFNGDDHVDVAVRQGAQIRFLDGDGGGGFTPGGAVDFFGGELHSGDLDGDGDADLVCLGSVVTVLLHDGQGQFSNSSFEANNTAAYSSGGTVCDVDGDGSLDVFLTLVIDVPYSTDHVIYETHLNDGAGNFSYRDGGSLGDYASEVAVGDIDGDEDLDLLINSDYPTLGILENVNGVLLVQHKVTSSASVGAEGTLIDYDSDGMLDIVSGGGGQFSLFRNNLAQRKDSFVQEGLVPAVDRLLLGADLDSDGDEDFLVYERAFTPGSGEQTLLHVYRNEGDASVSLLDTVDLGIQNLIGELFRIEAVDLDADGDRDVAYAHPGEFGMPGRIVALANDGAGGLELLGTPVPIDAFEFDVTFADLDHDGTVELIVCDGELRVFHQVTPGEFQLGAALDVPQTYLHGAWVRDFDRDGKLDVFTQYSSWAEAQEHGFAVFAGDGLGGLAPPVKQKLVGVGSIDDLVATDFDGDGVSDVAVVLREVYGAEGEATYRLSTYLAEPGAVTPPLAHSVVLDESFTVLAVEDMDGDGHPDLLSDELAVWRNDGTGGFTPSEPALDSHEPWLSAAVGDLDGDGSPELVYIDSGVTIVTHWNSATGSFEDSTWSYALGTLLFAPSPYGPDLLLAYLDGDEDLDLVSTDGDQQGGDLKLFRNVLDEPVPTLAADTASLSVAYGGLQIFSLSAGSEHANSLYFLLGSASGTTPGLVLGQYLLPLNPDGYFDITLTDPNTPVHGSTLGLLSAHGGANAILTLPAGLTANLVGITLHHAFVLIDETTYPGSPFITMTSNAVELELVP